MKLPYENKLYELRKWIDFTNANLNMQFLHLPPEIQSVRRWINAMAMGIQSDYPFYAAALPRIANILFQTNGMGAAFVNPAAFGELVIIIRHIEAEPVVVRFLVRDTPANRECLPRFICGWPLLNCSRKGSQRSGISSAGEVRRVKT